MKRFARKYNPLLLPAVLIAASALMFCEPGNSLNPGTPDNSGSDTAKSARITILEKPDQLLPSDTGLVTVSVVDSADTTKPLAGGKLSLSSTQFSLISANSAAAFPQDSFAIPGDGMINFRIHSSTAGVASVIVRVTYGGRTRSTSFTVQVTEKPAVPVIEETFPTQITPADTTPLTFWVKDSTGKALNKAVVTLSSDVFSIYHSADGDTFSVDTTGSDGKIDLRLLAGGAQPDHGYLAVRVKTAAGLVHSKTYNFSVKQASGTERPRQLVFTAMRSTLRADGSDSTELRVLVKDDNNNPMEGEKLHFTATGGVVKAEATTDAWGKTSTILVSERVNKTVVVTATLDKTGATAQQSVSFDGVSIAVNPEKLVLTTGATDAVTFQLNDGAQVPMSGDSLELVMKGAKNGFAQAGKDSIIVVTDTKGQYHTSVVADADGDVVMTARALGATTTETVTFTSQTLTIASSDLAISGDGVDVATLTATVKKGDGNPPNPGYELRWTTTFGTFTTMPFTTTDINTGKSTLVLRAPKGSGVATVNVEAYDKNKKHVASGNINVTVKALKVHRLEMKVTPDNIPVKVGEARLVATAFDSADNVMTGVLIGFRLVRGAGGGDELILPPVDYTKSGAAEAVLKAGGVISLYRGVKLAAVALDISGTDTLVVASSDTVSMTISGPPHRVSVGVNILKGLNPNDGTFGLPTAAVVTDVNGNLVADGTPVNFSTTQVSAIYTGTSWHAIDTWPYYVLGDTSYYELPWTDYNNNRKLDNGELPSTYALQHDRPARGEDKDGNGVINFPPETYEDINHNGVWDSANAEPNVNVAVFDSSGSPIYRTNFVDFNKNGLRDTVEPFFRNGRWTTDFSAGNGGACKCTGQYDGSGNLYEESYFGSASGHPFPGEVSVGIAKEVATVGGKATTATIYVQSLATKVKVRITAESNGVSSSVDAILPIVKDDGK